MEVIFYSETQINKNHGEFRETQKTPCVAA